MPLNFPSAMRNFFSTSLIEGIKNPDRVHARITGCQVKSRLICQRMTDATMAMFTERRCFSLNLVQFKFTPPVRILKLGKIQFPYDEVPQNENINFRSLEASVSVFRSHHNRLTPDIKRSIHKY